MSAAFLDANRRRNIAITKLTESYEQFLAAPTIEARRRVNIALEIYTYAWEHEQVTHRVMVEEAFQ